MTSSPITRPAGRPKSEKKRQQILKSASELVLSEGYANTSMDAVAKASGVSKQTVYSHFKNKDALYNAIIEEKCFAYQIEEASISLDETPLSNMLACIGERFIQLLLDENVVAMYQVVIGESKQNAHVAQLFYDAGPLHSIELVKKLLMAHPQSQLDKVQAKEVSCDFFNLLKSDFHMQSILHLPFHLDNTQQHQLAIKTAQKTMAIINLLKSSTKPD